MICGDRRLTDGAARLRDERLDSAAIGRRVSPYSSRLWKCFDERAAALRDRGVRGVPLQIGDELQVLLVQVPGLAEHQIRLEVLEELFRLGRVLTEALLRCARRRAAAACHRAPARRRRARHCRASRPGRGPSASTKGGSSPIAIGRFDDRAHRIEARQQRFQRSRSGDRAAPPSASRARRGLGDVACDCGRS